MDAARSQPRGARRRPGSGVRAALDAMVFGSAWVGLAAALLCAASAHAMGVPVRASLLALALCGTLAVYTADRLRDVQRDRRTAPARTAFVQAHARALLLAGGLAGLAAAGLALRSGPLALAVAAAVALPGFLHRRLKRFVWAKPVYLTAAWTAVAVGLPAAVDPAARHALAVSGVVAPTVLANVILSNLRDAEGGAARLGRRRALALAAAVLLPAGALALLGAETLRPLLALPIAMAAAVAWYRPGERHGHWVTDGALVLGALPGLLGASWTWG